jgi:hypothetical protein
MPGVPHLARFSRDVGYRRSTPQACRGSTHSHESRRSTRVPHVRTSVRGPKPMGEALHSFSSRAMNCRPEHPVLKSETWATHWQWRSPVATEQPLSAEAPPLPLSSRPEQSAVDRSLCGSFFRKCFPTENPEGSRVRGSVVLPSVLITRCGFENAVSVFRLETSSQEAPPSSLCHLDRSEAKWTDLCANALP